jgi:Helix-loop-helix DNA-binding domain
VRSSSVVESSNIGSTSKYKSDDEDNMTSDKSSAWDNDSIPHRSSITFNPVPMNINNTKVEAIQSQRCDGEVDVHIGKQIISFSTLDTTKHRRSRKEHRNDNTDGWMTTTPNDTSDVKKRRHEEDDRDGVQVNPQKKNRMDKNYREKIRSSRIANQIRDLHEILFNAGIKCPRSTKGMILAEAATYIRMLQQQQKNQPLRSVPSGASEQTAIPALCGVLNQGYVK